MKFIGLFIVSCILLVILVSVFGNFLGGFALLALPAFFIAAVLRMYMSIDERLEEIERRLGIIPEEEPKSFAEQVMENNQKEE
ncbi:MAG: hypothetical protein IJA67_02150 [Oscillospiraceae bacterium]|nr:hypothetical protein [Oscillospiraceae bacterium]